MAKPRRNYTLEAETVDSLERYASRHFNGNTSLAADHLLKKAMQEERRQTTEGLVYAGVGTTAMIILTLVPWLV